MTQPLSQIETFTESHVYKYPVGAKVADEQNKIFWFADELGIEYDEKDLRTNLTKAEIEAITYLQSILTKYEEHIGDDLWSDKIPKLFPRPEIIRACRAIANIEDNGHNPLYKGFNEILHKSTDEFYSQWRYDGHLYPHLKFVHNCTKDQDALVVTGALCALEGIMLFSAFAFFKAFNTRGWNYIPHFVAGIDASAKDENFHSEFSAWLFKQCKLERTELGNHDAEKEKALAETVEKIVRTMYQHELTIIDKMFEFEHKTDSKIRVINKEELINFVQDRTNTVLTYLGYEPLFAKEKGEISKIFYNNISSFKSSDFFANIQLQYTRKFNPKKFTFSYERVKHYVEQ